MKIHLFLTFFTLLVPSFVQAQTFQSTAYLLAYVDSEGNLGPEQAPESYLQSVSLRWKVTRNKKGNLIMKAGSFSGLKCTYKGTKLTCPARGLVQTELGPCLLQQSHIINLGSRGYTMKLKQELNCNNGAYQVATQYLGAAKYP